MTSLALQQWPEPIIRVQSISESGSTVIPDKYIKPASERPSFNAGTTIQINIPLIDLQELVHENNFSCQIMNQICMACKDWGFFQVVNHGVKPELLHLVREAWKQFFHLRAEEKQAYANSPATYEGYGSRVGIGKDTILDWNDYFFLHYLPNNSLEDHKKWPTSSREVIEEYGKELVKLSKTMLKVLSISLGIEDEYLYNAFGGEDVDASMRVNYYPKCPQPELALGLSSHSDPGGLTILLQDDHVSGLQIRKDDNWVTVEPIPNTFIVNIGDQIQVLSNAIYKSIEHRAIVNPMKERLSLAFFYNPRTDLLIEPAKKFVTTDRPALYPPMTFNEYRAYIRTKGLLGKSQVESLESTL